jgi:cytochrome c553
MIYDRARGLWYCNLVQMRIPGCRQKQTILVSVAVAGVTAWFWFAVPLTAQKNPSSPDFERDIAPVFKQSCAACHSGTTPQGELDLTSLQGALKGGKSGKAIVPGSSGQSPLVEKIVSGTMPPGKTKLEEKDISLIRAWIDAGAGSEAGGTKASTAAALTENDVIPIFQMRCVLCHGKRRQEGGLDLRTQAGRLKGGKSGPAFVPGKPDESLAMKRILAGEMPPPKMFFEYAVRPPDTSEVETLRKWIASGCPPAPQESVLAESAPDPLVKDEARKFWSFQPPQRSAVPQVSNPDRVRNPIDAFLLQKLETKGLSFSAEADRAKLMRRAYIDLIGMPPSPAEIETYLADTRPDAYERLIDQLLASPHYGERWGLYWLNAAGYSDSEGIIDEDLVRPHAWRYRDYVIRSFNQDKPYDQFLMEQIAGDELVDYKGARQATPELLEKLTATGFLRMVPDGTYSPSNSSIPERMAMIADEVEVLSSAVMGLTMGCARCHNHKYDPIPQRDYYRLSAILMAAYDPYDWLIPASGNPYKLKYETRHIDLALETERQEVERFNKPLETEQKQLENALEKASQPFREKLLQERLEALPQSVRDDLRKTAETSEEKRTNVQKYLAEKFESTLKITTEDLIKKYPEFKPEGERLRKAIDETKARLRPKPQIRALFDMGGEPSAVYLLRRGDVRTPGERVQPGVPSVLRAGLKPYKPEPPRPGSDSSGRRLALARWLVQPNHPLTSRVMVNRIWMHHFGRGIVASPANFGHTGSPPSHPELLDWLATEFVRQRWSVKAMHRLIMTSSAYRQTSRIDAKAHEADPDNVLISRMPMRRLDAEALYDSVLAVTGRLDPAQFGAPAEIDMKPDGEVTAKPAKAGYRRSIYVLQRRVYPMTQLDVFDLPQLGPNCIERRQSTVPTQALQMMNGDTLRELSRYMAGRLIDEFGEDERKQIGQAYLRAYSRQPSQAEMETALQGIGELKTQWMSHLEQEKPETPKMYTARWRALADLCRTLLSSAEFLYVD